MDEWIEKNSALGVERTHALGAIAFSWNLAEYWSVAILSEVAAVKEEIARALAHDMSMPTLWAKIIDIAERRGLEEPVVDGLKDTRRLFEANRQNRNAYVHSVGTMRSPGLAMTKNKGPGLFGNPIPDSIDDLRRVHGEIKVLVSHLQEACLSFAKVGAKPSPFPQTPAPPKTIQPLPARQGHAKP
jgi:hypothetical protein